MPRRICSSVAFGFWLRRWVACTTMPGVQNPHCTAHLSTKPFFTASAFGSAASPSMVTTSRPLQSTANSRQELSDAPSTRIVQAPHSPSPQPYFVPVNPSTSRSISRALISTGTVALRATPFSLKLISSLSDICQHPFDDVVDEFLAVPRRGANVGNGLDFVVRRRRDLVDQPRVEFFALYCRLGERGAQRPRRDGAQRPP